MNITSNEKISTSSSCASSQPYQSDITALGLSNYYYYYNGPSGWGTSKLDSIRIFYIQLLSTVHGIMLNFCNNNYSFKIPWLNETGTPQFIPTRHLYMAGRVLFRVGHTPCLETAVKYVNKKMKSNKKIFYSFKKIVCFFLKNLMDDFYLKWNAFVNKK